MTRLPAATLATEGLSPLTHWYSDGAGNSTFGVSALFPIPAEDLIATNVRSFDVKALDPNSSLYSTMIGGNTTPQYVDLGYAMQFKPAGSLVTHDGELTQTTAVGEAPTFGHEGRIPPFTADNRVDPQWPNQVWTTTPWAPNNIGDNATGVVRLRRVWDSWSTTYTRAPATPINPFQGAPFARPTYPSYPPPYPSPLLGLRIQIRLYDQPETGGTPRAKQLTITQDFTDKL
jgi:hypothetical protein